MLLGTAIISSSMTRNPLDYDKLVSNDYVLSPVLCKNTCSSDKGNHDLPKTHYDCHLQLLEVGYSHAIADITQISSGESLMTAAS